MSKTNRYRSGSKNPHREVLVTDLPNGTVKVVVADWAKGRIMESTVGAPNAGDDQNLTAPEKR